MPNPALNVLAMHLEHIGIAVRDAAAVADVYHTLFGIRPYRMEEVQSEHVRTVFLTAGGPKLELLEATSDTSPIARHLDSRGEGLHHVAFEVDDLDAAHARLADAGFRLLNPEPKRGADDKRIFFIHPRDTAGVLIELCQTSPTPLEPAFAKQGAERVAFYERGRADAPPLVLLHAAMGSTEMETRRLMPFLEQHYRVVAIDFASHGASSDFEGSELTIDLFADNVLTVLDHLAIEKANLFGFSMGASVALYLAHTQPARAERLAIHGTNVQWDSQEASAMIDAMRPAVVERENPRFARWLARAHGDPRWRHLAERMIRFTEPLPQTRFLDDDLATIDIPTLVSHGDSDRYFRLAHALNLHRTLPDARLAVHPGLDHPIQGVDARAFSEMLRRFYDGSL